MKGPCEGPRFHEFDFWIGQWTVHRPDGQVAGTNAITSEEAGCAIVERWTSAAGGTGQSLNFYDPAADRWRQVWIGLGLVLTMEGGLVDGAMILEGPLQYVATGRITRLRGVWTPLPDGRVRQEFQESADGGRTWTLWFDGYYSRIETGAGAPGAGPDPGILGIALETRAARLAGDNARWLELARQVQARAPEHPDLMISLARAYAANGRIGESIPQLELAIARGAGFELFAFPEFKDHAIDTALVALAGRAAANQAPVQPPEEWLVIENTDIRPEGIAWDADGSRLFFGSLNGEIWAVGEDRRLSRFAGPDAGLREVLGMKVDRARRILWAVTGVFPDFFGSPEALKPDMGLTGVVAFDLDSAKRVRECRLDERPVLHGFNDLALAANGDVYVSDTTANSIWRLPRGECRLEVVIRDARMGAPNGIALSADEKLLYVAHIEGLSAVDLGTGRRTLLPVPANTTVNSMDGLVRDGDDLIGIQPTPYLARVVRIRLAGDGLAVREAVTVSSRPPPGVSQTTGTVAGAHYYSVAGTIDALQAYAEGDRRARILRSKLR